MTQFVEEPLDPTQLPIAHLGRPIDESDESAESDEQPSGSHLRAIVLAAAAIVVVGLVVGIVLVNSSAPPLGRGAESARSAAAVYLAAINAGDENAAADIACKQFADEARAQAGSGADDGISFGLQHVRMLSKTDAIVTLTERLELPNGKSHSQPIALAITRSGGRWLVCGRAG